MDRPGQRKCLDEQFRHLGLGGGPSSQAPVEHATAGSPQTPGLCPPEQHPAGRACWD